MCAVPFVSELAYLVLFVLLVSLFVYSFAESTLLRYTTQTASYHHCTVVQKALRQNISWCTTFTAATPAGVQAVPPLTSL